MTAQRLLVTGASGQVGRAFAGAAAGAGYAVACPTRAELDLASEVSIRAAVRAERWSAVVNCAAYTAVDAAEAEPQLARAVNAVAPGLLAREAARGGIPIVHVSTDYVFDGRKPAPYVESDPVNPLSVYGRTKAEGEEAVRNGNERHAIVRTSWVVSDRGRNFVTTMMRLAAERAEIAIVDDQRGCPTAAGDVAEALLAVTTSPAGRAGTWHFANSGEASWFELASFIFSAAGEYGRPVPSLIPIGTCDYPRPAARPRNSRLATARFTADFGRAPRPWQEAIGEIVAQICKDVPAAGGRP